MTNNALNAVATYFHPNRLVGTFESLFSLVFSFPVPHVPSIHRNGQVYEFSELNKNQRTPLKGKPILSREDNMAGLLDSRETGKPYQRTSKKCYFKIKFGNRFSTLYVNNNNVYKKQGRSYRSFLEFGNSTFVLNLDSKYQLYYEIEGYLNSTSEMYI